MIMNAEIVKAEEKCFDSEVGGFSPDMMAEAFELENSRTDYGAPSSEVEESKTEESESSDNGIQKIAKNQLKNAYNNFVGSLENELQDNEEDSEEYQKAYKILHGDSEYIVNEIYSDALDYEFAPGYQGGYGSAPKEMRFAGRDFCLNYLRDLLMKDGYGKTVMIGHYPKVITRKYRGSTINRYKCPVCGHITGHTKDNFCIYCGTHLNHEGEDIDNFMKLEEERPNGTVQSRKITKYGKIHYYCPNCGTRVDWKPDQMCCHNCGQKVINNG